MLRNSRQTLLSSWTFATSSQTASTRRLLASNASTMSSGRRVAGYIAAGTTVGAITCYRPDWVIANDPYNASGAIVAAMAHYAVNPSWNFSWILLGGFIAVGEFLGNGFRVVHQQYFAITVTDEQRHQLLDDAAIIAETKVKDMDKDMLDVFENCISTIVLLAKTRWMHLCHAGDGHIPDHMST